VPSAGPPFPASSACRHICSEARSRRSSAGERDGNGVGTVSETFRSWSVPRSHPRERERGTLRGNKRAHDRDGDVKPGHSTTRRSTASLRDALAQLPDDALVPVQWVRQHLDSESPDAAPERLWTVHEVAERYERSQSTVRGWCAKGELSAFKLHRTAWRIPESALENFDVRQQRGSRRCALGQRESANVARWRRERPP